MIAVLSVLLITNFATALVAMFLFWNMQERYHQWLSESFKYEQQIRLLKDVIASQKPANQDRQSLTS